MKKTRNILVLSLALLSIVSMGSVAGTYAKYTTTKTSSDSARVAKWGIGITNQIDLFDASYIGSESETDVVASDGENVVAPGTTGTYTFRVTGAPETNYTIAVAATVTDQIGRIKYYLDDEAKTTALTAAQLEAKLEELYSNQVFAANADSESEHTITWEWLIEETVEENLLDATDTILGDEGTKTVEIEVTITATQSELKAGSRI